MTNNLEQRARELLAAEYHKRGWTGVAIAIDRGVLTALSEAERAGLIAIEAALRLSAGADWPERFACNGPEGTFWTNDSAMANKLIAAAFDRDEWTVTDTAAPRHETGDALRGDKT